MTGGGPSPENHAGITVTIRFYEELGDFLLAAQRKRDLAFSDIGRRSIKDFIESLGVPHAEVDLILVNGEPVGFDYIVQQGDRISVYPVFERLNIKGVSKLSHAPLRQSTFLVDNNLGKLARNLRLLGFDVLYDPKLDDSEIATLAPPQNRIILTRDRALLMRKNVTHGLFIRNTAPFDQTVEVLRRLDLKEQMAPLSRCLPCGARLSPYPQEKARDDSRIPPCIKAVQHQFYRCESCHKVYWQGHHYDDMKRFVALIHDHLNKEV
jgi:uncharacterized protein with PIN domain/sulfur carrier protein ThiS